MDFIIFLEQQWLLVALLSGIVSLWFLLEKRHAANSLSPQEAVLAMNNPDCTVIDVRPAKSFATGHIAKSINIPYKDSQCIQTITQVKSAKKLLICDRGMQSKALAGQLQTKKVACEVLKGGLEAWRIEGFPVRTIQSDKKNNKEKESKAKNTKTKEHKAKSTTDKDTKANNKTASKTKPKKSTNQSTTAAA